MFGITNGSYQPAQLYHLAQNGFRCELFAADECLMTDVYYYWKLEIVTESIVLPIIPDGAFDLVLSPELPDFVALFPPRKEPFEISLQGPITYVGICFRVEKASQLFSRSLADLEALEAVPEVVKALQLQNLMQLTQNEFDIARLSTLFDDFLSAYRPATPANGSANMMTNLLELLEAGTIHTMASQLEISERQFRRIAHGLFGLSPKQIQRILRLQLALRELLHPDIPRVADYYDDSHRIRELKALTGLTPGEIRRMADLYNQNQRH